MFNAFNHQINHRISLTLTLLTAILIGPGCAYSPTSLIGSSIADRLSFSILNNNDPQTVAEAMPSLLVLIDSMTQEDASSDMLLAAAKLYSAYAGNFLQAGERQQRLSIKGMSYASKGACKYSDIFCALPKKSFQTIEALTAEIGLTDVPVIYTFASSWLGYIQSHSDDWEVIADLPKVKALLERLLVLNENYDNGGVHLYLGGIATLLPPALGGKPEIGKHHFERAIALSNGHNLIAKVEYARRYAKLLFDQELHHRLLTEVLETKIEYQELTLINALAHQQAKQLLAEESDYF